jgi:hypothetical protein
VKALIRTAPFSAALLVAGLISAPAHAQWYSSAPSQPPLYPYAVQASRPYAVEVAPNTYVIQRPAVSRHRAAAKNRKAPSSGRSKTDPALVEELRNRPKLKRSVIETTHVVREKPVVIETKRYVDDPPRVIERYNIVEDKPAPAKTKRIATAESGEAPVIDKRAKKDNVKRVINAEAEITILGPDRMSIRLFRKGDGTRAKASAE